MDDDVTSSLRIGQCSKARAAIGQCREEERESIVEE